MRKLHSGPVSSKNAILSLIGCSIAISILIYHYSMVVSNTNIPTLKQLRISSNNTINNILGDKSLFKQEVLPHYVVCAVSQLQAGSFLFPQWIDYHSIVGIDHFFIISYCDNESDKTASWISLYKQLGLVTPSFNVLKSNCTSLVNNALGSNFFSNQVTNLLSNAKSQCDWIINLSTDEYIFPGNEDIEPNLKRRSKQVQQLAQPPTEGQLPESTRPVYENEFSFVKNLLTNSSQTLYRLPIYLMSSHKFDDHQQGTLIDNYLYGQFNSDAKIFVKSELIKRINVPLATDSVALDQQQTYEFDSDFLLNPDASSLMSTKVIEGELQPLSAEKSMCSIPSVKKTPLFIKHYKYLSYQDYIKYSPETNKTREKWLKTHVKRKCPLLFEDFVNLMSKKMLEASNNNIKELCQGNFSSWIPDKSLITWLNGDLLPVCLD